MNISKEQKIIDTINNTNLKGNEKFVISLIQQIASDDYDTQKKYIKAICKSVNPVSAALAISTMNHSFVLQLKQEIVQDIMYGNWNTSNIILSFVYMDDNDNLQKFLNTGNIIVDDIRIAKDYLLSQSSYEQIFNLIFNLSKSTKSTFYLSVFKKNEIHKQYIDRNRIKLEESLNILYEKDDFDSIFTLSKSFELLLQLKEILKMNSDDLINSFLTSGTMNGIRLAFRILEISSKNTIEAYRKIIQKIILIEKTDETIYMHFYYLLKFIDSNIEINEDVKIQLMEIGEIKLLEKNPHGIYTLSSSLETILLNKGLDEYLLFIEILNMNNNNIFIKSDHYSDFNVRRIYKFQLNEIYNIRKNNLEKMYIKQNWTNKAFFNFYMSSFYKFFVPINELFNIMYRRDEDNIPLYYSYSKDIFSGKVCQINERYESISISFENVASNKLINVNGKSLGYDINLLKIGDVFSFTLKRYNPRTKQFTIDNLKIQGMEKQKSLDNTINKNWMRFVKICNKISRENTLTKQDIMDIESLFDLKILKNSHEIEFLKLYAEVIYAISNDVQQVSNFLMSLNTNKNNIFDNRNRKINFISINYGAIEKFIKEVNFEIDRNDQYVPELAMRTYECLIATNVDSLKLVNIFMNSHLRLFIPIQLLIADVTDENASKTDLTPQFSGFRFFGILDYFEINSGNTIVNVRPFKIKTSNQLSFQFILENESAISDEMVEKQYVVSFRLSNYCSEENKLNIDNLVVHRKTTREGVSNWRSLHQSHQMIVFTKKLLKEAIENLERIERLEFIQFEHRQLLKDFTWCMMNLCDQNKDLYKYLKALNVNNPYRFNSKANAFITHELYSRENESEEIIDKIINGKYRFDEIMYIYFNSFIRFDIPLNEIIERYYSIKSPEQSVIYFTGWVKTIVFSAVISSDDYTSNRIFVELENMKEDLKVYFEKDNSDVIKQNFTSGDKVRVTLEYFDRKLNIIQANYEE